jgi:hypothetical protein
LFEVIDHLLSPPARWLRHRKAHRPARGFFAVHAKFARLCEGQRIGALIFSTRPLQLGNKSSVPAQPSGRLRVPPADLAGRPHRTGGGAPATAPIGTHGLRPDFARAPDGERLRWFTQANSPSGLPWGAADHAPGAQQQIIAE